MLAKGSLGIAIALHEITLLGQGDVTGMENVATRAEVRRVRHACSLRLSCSAAKLGVTKLTASSYNQAVMPTVTDAMQEFQFASARVLARLPRVSAALSVCPAIASASQPVR